MDILMRELMALYNAYVRGESSPLPPLRIQYRDYACWQQEQSSGEAYRTDKAWWLQQFEGELPMLDLPSDRLRPSVKTYRGGVVNREIGGRLSQGIKQLSHQRGCTLFMGMLVVVTALLYRYSEQEGIIIGRPVAGRDHIDLEEQVGLYVNTLALRTLLKGGDSYLEVLERVRAITVEAYAHQGYPFDALVEALPLQRDMSRNALFDVMLVLQHAESLQGGGWQNLGDMKVSEYKGRPGVVSKFDLLFNVVDRGEELALSIEYNSDLYKEGTIRRLSDHFEGLLGAILSDPTLPVIQRDYLSGDEKDG